MPLEVAAGIPVTSSHSQFRIRARIHTTGTYFEGSLMRNFGRAGDFLDSMTDSGNFAKRQWTVGS